MSQFLARLPEFLGNHWMLAAAFVALLVVLIFTELARLKRGFKEVTPAMLTQLINRDDAMVFDLSPRTEFDKGHIPGSRHVDHDQFDPAAEKLAKLHDKPVVVVCKTGRTSLRAAAQLHKTGFNRAYTLGGGVDAWRQANLPLATGRK